MEISAHQGRKGDLSSKQLLAIKAAIKLGCTLQKDLPLIIEDYRGGKYIGEIVREQKIDRSYKVSYNTARSAVYYCFHGYSGNLFASYPGLANDSELEQLCLNNKRRNGEVVGKSGVGVIAITGQDRKDIAEKSRKTNKINKTGIFGLTKEKRNQMGNTTAEIHKKRKTGFFAYDSEEQSRKGRVTAERKGLKLVSLEEQAYLLALPDYEEFRYQDTNQKGKLAWPKIAIEINEVFHNSFNVRTTKTLMKYLYRALK